jgi:hypothetical protein
MCGRSTAGWLTIGTIEALDQNCCEQCKAKMAAMPVVPA